MGITQDVSGDANAKGARADLGDMNLNALFTGATCVRVANKREASLEVTKKVVVPPGLTGKPNAGFTFKFTVPTTAGKTYKAAVFENAGTASEKQVGKMFDLENGREQTITAGQTIRVYGLAVGDKYEVRELTDAGKMPGGFTLTGREKGGNALSGEGDSISGTIAKKNADGAVADANKLAFTNTYSVKPPVTLTNAFWAQKVLRGRDWKDGDSFKIYLRADKGTPMPAGAKDAPVSGMKQVVKTVKNGDKFDFGNIEYAKPGTYTYLIAEATPSQNDADWLPGFGYSSATYRVTVTVRDNGDGTLSQPAVKMEQTYTDDGMSQKDNPIEVADKIAKITNTYNTDEKTISFNVQKTYADQSGANPLVKDKFTFQLEALGGMKNDAVPSGAIDFGKLATSYSVGASKVPMPKGCTSTTTTAKNDDEGIAAFPQITYTMGSENLTYVYKVTEVKDSDTSTSSGMGYDDAVYYVLVKNQQVDNESGTGKCLSSTVTYWKADGTQLTDANGYIPFKNTYTVTQAMSAPVNVQKTFTGRAWETSDAFDFTLTPADDATRDAVKNKVVTQKTGTGEDVGDIATKISISGDGSSVTRTATFGVGDLVFTKPGTYKFKVNEKASENVDKTGISYDGHTSTVTYTVTDVENGKHAGKLTASVAYDNKQATTDVDRQVTGAAAFTNTYTASGTYAGIDVTKTLVGTPLKNGMFPFTIEAMTYNGTTAPEPADTDKSFKNTVGKDDGNDTQTATMSGKLKMNFTQLSYNKVYVYKVSEVHGANAGGYTYDTEYPGDAYVLIAVKPNPDNKGQLYTETTIVKGPDVTALVGENDNVDALTAEAIKGLDTTTNYVQTVSSRDAKPATPIVPFKNSYKSDASDELTPQVTKKISGVESTEKAFSFTLTATEETQQKIVAGDLGVSDDLAGDAHAESKATKDKIIKDKGQTVDFSNMTFNKAGEYTFTLTEVHNADDDPAADGVQNAGWTMDASTYTVTVRVEDKDAKLTVTGVTVKKDGDAEAKPIKAEVKDGKVNLATFINSYAAKGSVTLAAKKRFRGGALAGNDFSFALYKGDKAEGTPIEAVTNDEKGNITFQPINYTEAGDYEYTIKEVKGADPTVVYDGQEVKVKVSVTDNKNGTLGATATYGGDEAVPTFTNSKPTADVTVEATKVLAGKDLTADAFTFGLYDQDGNEDARGTNDKNGKVKLTVKGLNLGEYDYTLKEEKAGQTVDGVAYDAKEVKVHVKVEQNQGDNNKTKVTVTYDGAATAPTFNNTYDAKGSVILTATKTIKVADGFDHTTKPADGEFTFDLKDAAGNVLDTAKNDANGKVSFTREFQLSDLDGAASKDFTYTIVEQPGAEPGMVYDSHPLTYTVTVTDGGNGALNAKAIVTSASGSDTFTNTYQPAATGLALGAQKSYVKKDDNTPIVPKCGEFTFDVYEGNLTAEQLAGAKPVRTATNGADGSVNFDAFSYAKPGTHEYTIVERKGDLAYVTYDAAVHHAVVTVADNAGTLQASVAYDGTNVTKPSFTNTYEAQATDSGAIALTKSVDVHDGSYQLKAGDFAFELVGSDGSVIQTQKNDAHGKVAFDKLTFDHAGTFTYTVREVQPTGDAPGVPGVTYTGKTYTLTYVVKDNNDGKLVVESSTVKPSEGTENGVTPNTMTFANSYQPGQTSYQISGTKVLENADPATTRTPADGEFTFALIDVATGQEIDRTTNVGKAFTFKAISYTATGSHAYQVKEVAGQDGTITYSDAVLDVTVNVTDDGSGQLTATANKTAADLTFTNTYTPTATTATITGTKALTGRDLAEGEFFFDLKDADGNVVQTVQNGADGTFGFAPLQLDKVGTYVYTVSERAGATANGVTYDTTVFTATVTVTENAETHALEAQVAYSKGGKAADAVAFSNSYAPAATEVKLGASKVLSGEDLKEGQFSFQLKDADGKVLQTAKNAADGTVGFGAISYDKPGTYAYSISEVDDGQKNVTYDAAEHRVTVTVTDDGAGHLVATVTYDGAVAPVFKNTYTPPTTPPTEPPTNPPSKSPVPKEEKPGLPYTGDTSLSPMALGGIAGGAVVLIAAGVILRRRNR